MAFLAETAESHAGPDSPLVVSKKTDEKEGMPQELRSHLCLVTLSGQKCLGYVCPGAIAGTTVSLGQL